MRTRIDIADDQREKLLQLAAERGERSCARLVHEAVAQYLDQKERPAEPVVLQLEAQPSLRADTRAQRARLVIEWVWEEAVGLMSMARNFRARLRRSTAPAS
jgi:hypothetical protein